MTPERLPAISLRGVTVRHPGAAAPALQEVDMDVYPGEFVGVVGATGSGKSTLLQVMSGIIPHYRQGKLTGEVRFFGRPTWELSLAKIARFTGMVMQDPESQLFNLIVRDEVVWGMENRGFPRAEMRRRLESALELLQIVPLRDRITYDLSGGEKQRVALAAVHVTEPDILLLDNPTSQLDPDGAAAVMEAIRRVVDANPARAVVMVEDKVDELLEFAHRLVLMHEGRKLLDGSPREFCAQHEVLRGAGLRPSQIAELGVELMRAGVDLPRLPITLTEGIALFGELLRQREGARR